MLNEKCALAFSFSGPGSESMLTETIRSCLKYKQFLGFVFMLLNEEMPFHVDASSRRAEEL